MHWQKIPLPHLGYSTPEKVCSVCIAAMTAARPDLPPRPVTAPTGKKSE